MSDDAKWVEKSLGGWVILMTMKLSGGCFTRDGY